MDSVATTFHVPPDDTDTESLVPKESDPASAQVIDRVTNRHGGTRAGPSSLERWTGGPSRHYAARNARARKKDEGELPARRAHDLQWDSHQIRPHARYGRRSACGSRTSAQVPGRAAATRQLDIARGSWSRSRRTLLSPADQADWAGDKSSSVPFWPAIVAGDSSFPQRYRSDVTSPSGQQGHQEPLCRDGRVYMYTTVMLVSNELPTELCSAETHFPGRRESKEEHSALLVGVAAA